MSTARKGSHSQRRPGRKREERRPGGGKHGQGLEVGRCVHCWDPGPSGLAERWLCTRGAVALLDQRFPGTSPQPADLDSTGKKPETPGVSKQSGMESGGFLGSLWHHLIAPAGPRPEILSWGVRGEPWQLPMQQCPRPWGRRCWHALRHSSRLQDEGLVGCVCPEASGVRRAPSRLW